MWKVLVRNFIWFWRQAECTQNFQIQVILWTLPTVSEPLREYQWTHRFHPTFSIPYIRAIHKTLQNLKEQSLCTPKLRHLSNSLPINILQATLILITCIWLHSPVLHIPFYLSNIGDWSLKSMCLFCPPEIQMKEIFRFIREKKIQELIENICQN